MGLFGALMRFAGKGSIVFLLGKGWGVDARFMYVGMLACCFFLFLRQGKGEGGSFAHFRAGRDCAAQPVNNGVADGQSQSCALCEAIHLDETFKDLVQLAGFDADAGVADVELYPVSFAAIPLAAFALGGEFKGISDKVGYHLEDAVLVSFDGYLFVRRLVDEFHPLRTAELQRIVYLPAE